MRRHILTSCVLITLIFGLLGYSPAVGEFLDVLDTDWYAEAVRELSADGAISGRRTMVGFFFQPTEPIRRAEFAKLIGASLFTTRPCPASKQIFSDVALDHWASPWVNLVSRFGVMEGQDGLFAPDAFVSRAEAAKIVALALNLELSTSASFPFLDVRPTDWFAPYVLAVYKENLMKGFNGSFRPGALINRAEAAHVIYLSTKVREGIGEPKIEVQVYRPPSSWMDEILVDDEDKRAGIGVRLNRPGFANVQKIHIKASPLVQPSRLRYLLSRSNDNINVWFDRERATPLLRDLDRAEITETAAIQGIDLFVENVKSGESILRIDVQSGNSIVASDLVRLATFDSLVVALGGENQDVSTWRNDLNLGVFHAAHHLYSQGYDTLIFGEYHVDNFWDMGKGPVYDAILEAVRYRGVKRVVLFGYSHGAGSLRNLLRRIEIERNIFGSDFEVVYVAYIDGIVNPGPFPETEPPPLVNTFVNIFQSYRDGHPLNCSIYGVSIAGAREVRVNDHPWGEDLHHCSIDDDEHVRSIIVSDIQETLGCGLVVP